MIWHSTNASDVLNQLQVDDKKGLSNGIVEQKQEKYGTNIISKIEKPSFFKRFLSQLNNKIVIILIITAILSFGISAFYDGVNNYSPLLIIAIVVINAFISAYYMCESDNAIDRMKNATNPVVTVLRDGIVKNISSVELVPGDIMLLEEGDYISADARLVECNEFRCNESAITDDEIPVEKDADVVVEDITTIDKRINMVYSGCSVVHGNAKACVVSTGLNTEMGRSSALLQQTGEDALPLEEELNVIGKAVNIIILIVCIFVFGFGIYQNFRAEHFASMMLSVLVNTIALGVAAIPEGLPAISTIAISLGVQRIIHDKIIIKDSKALELLGKTNVLCSDKTGVLTRNKMQVSKLFDGKNLIDCENDTLTDHALLLLKLATACTTLNNDSTENAIEKACLAYNSMSFKDISVAFPKLSVIPFDSVRKSMTVITMINEKPFAIVKGAPEIILKKCRGIKEENFLSIAESMADDALRVIAIAMRPLKEIPANPNSDDIENSLTFVGLIGLLDPPRDTVIRDIKACNNAGVRTIMVTGDSAITAGSIARRIGILKDGTEILTGEELDNMTDEELYENIERYSVFARITPLDKTRIVRAWQSKKCVVTITGDSVQDADALALADVGCAIGKFGTDVAKGNADIVISNNKFSSIVIAIKESRGLFSNIRKSVYYLLSCNFGELLTMLVGMILFKNMPLAAVQLLWINLLTDSAPAISLSMESAEASVMNKKPSGNRGKIFDVQAISSIIIQSIFITAMSLISFAIGNKLDYGVASSMAFVTLGITQIFHCYNNKYESSILKSSLFKNRFMNISAGLTLFIMIFLVLSPGGYVFSLSILTFKQFIIAFVLAFLIVPFTELLKLLKKVIDK